jgi:hypothetical protein
VKALVQDEDYSQQIEANIEAEGSAMTITLKTQDSSELVVEGCIETLLACASQMAHNYDIDFQVIVDEFMLEAVRGEEEGVH